MENSPNEIQTRANTYAFTRGLMFEDSLGFGFDGIVYSTKRQSAVKVFRHEQLYRHLIDGLIIPMTSLRNGMPKRLSNSVTVGRPSVF